MSAHPSEEVRVHAVIVRAVTEMRLYDLRVTVERIEGRSVCGLEVGDYFEVTESSRVRIPEGKHFCLFALQSVLPLLLADPEPEDDQLWDAVQRLPFNQRAVVVLRDIYDLPHEAIADPYVSFDGQSVYFAKMHDALKHRGSDIYRVHVPTRDDQPERERQAALSRPPFTEVDAQLQAEGRVRELAFVDDEPGCRAPGRHLVQDLVDSDLLADQVVPPPAFPQHVEEEAGLVRQRRVGLGVGVVIDDEDLQRHLAALGFDREHTDAVQIGGHGRLTSW